MLWKDALSLANVPVGSVCRDKSGKIKKVKHTTHVLRDSRKQTTVSV